MPVTRRKFLIGSAAASGMTAAVGGVWLGRSNSPRARLLRGMLNDIRRTPAQADEKPDPGQWSDNQITLAWLGHSTVFINFYGFHVLTDPVFSDRVGLDLALATAGPKRLIAAAMKADELPRIDLVLLSHGHYDHMDLPSLKRCVDGAAAVTARDTTDVLAGTPLREAIELGWGDRTVVRRKSGEMGVEAFEVRHWGARWPSDKPRGYNGYVLSREGRRLIFGGDTAFIETFAELRFKGPFEAALMPIGAYRPWIRNHCTPEQALLMADRAGARRVAAIHHQTFKLSEEPMREPIERLEAAMSAEAGRLAFRKVGETLVLG